MNHLDQGTWEVFHSLSGFGADQYSEGTFAVEAVL